jgi:beta-galactosidase
VTASTGTAPDGRRVHVVHNWSWQPADVQAPVDLADVLDGNSISSGAAFRLGAWDVRIFVTGSAGQGE